MGQCTPALLFRCSVNLAPCGPKREEVRVACWGGVRGSRASSASDCSTNAPTSATLTYRLCLAWHFCCKSHHQ